MPWWNTTSGSAHGAEGVQVPGTLGIATSTGMVCLLATKSAGPKVLSFGLSAPVAGSRTSSDTTVVETNLFTFGNAVEKPAAGMPNGVVSKGVGVVVVKNAPAAC